MFDPAILLNLEAHPLPEPPPMVMKRVHRDALGAEFHRIGTKMADTFEAQVEGYVGAMAAVQQQHRGVKPTRRASPEDVAEFTRSIANHERAAEMRAKRATRAQKQAERQAKAEAEMSPSLAMARRQITKRIVAADRRLVDALLDYALFLRAIRSELDPAQGEGQTFDDAASLHDFLAGLGAV